MNDFAVGRKHILLAKVLHQKLRADNLTQHNISFKTRFFQQGEVHGAVIACIEEAVREDPRREVAHVLPHKRLEHSGALMEHTAVAQYIDGRRVRYGNPGLARKVVVRLA